MAEPLKNYLDERIPLAIASQISAGWRAFPTEEFLRTVRIGYDDLELMDRGRHIARALRSHLPAGYAEALDILLRSIGTRPQRAVGDGGMASFLYLPHVQFIEEFGLDDFDLSMRALYILTQRFTAEFSVRPFLERYEAESLALLHRWTRDPDPHVRRLTSEGTRPRLPWAARLRRFQKDPAPVLAILEQLRDDHSEFVRRSVANNLNDIGKDHPDVLLDVARRWMIGASAERRALVRHALRGLVKSGDAEALAILGYGSEAEVEVGKVEVEPTTVAKGEAVTIKFILRSTGSGVQRLLVDLRVHYAKANGSTSPRVFKLRTLELGPGAEFPISKRLSLADLTTRKHYVGRHVVELLINGRTEPIGEFVVTEEPSLGGV